LPISLDGVFAPSGSLLSTSPHCSWSELSTT
jgi:hypothetical protein